MSKLTAKMLRQWLLKLSQTPPRLRTRAGEPQRYRELSDDPEAVRRRRASANRTWNFLQAALNRAFTEGRAPSDVAWRRVESFSEADAARVAFLSVEEAQLFFERRARCLQEPRSGGARHRLSLWRTEPTPRG